MKPVTVRTRVAKPVEEVYDHLDALANHAAFVDHLFTDWTFSGPARGVGAKGTARTNAPGSQDWTEFEVIESERPSRIVERAVDAKEKRETRGTYTLTSDGEGTEISFELEWLKAARTERFFGPLTGAFVRRANGKSMRRLAKILEADNA
jgi:Polyketide cyclase / dehydrase and lipid transport